MTISVVALGTTTNISGAATSVSPPEPAGVQEGDFLVACVSYNCTSANTPSIPAGWTLIRNQQSVDGSFRNGLIMAYIEREASAPASTTFTFSGTPANGVASIIGLRSSRGRLVYDTSNGASSGGAATTLSSPSITTARANEMLILAGGGAGTGTASGYAAATAPTSGSWTEQLDAANSSGYLYIATAIKTTAAATGTFGFTTSTSQRRSQVAAAFYEEYHLRASTGTFTSTFPEIESPAGVQMQYIGGQTFVPVAGGGSPNTISSVPIGATDVDRRLLIGVCHQVTTTAPATGVVDSVTIDGNACTRLVEAGTTNNVSWWLSDVFPSETDADIIVTPHSSVVLGTNYWGKIHVYRLVGARGTAFDTLTDTGSSGSNDPTGTLDLSRFGVGVVLTAGGFYQTTAATHVPPTDFEEDSETAELRPTDSRRMTNSVSSLWNGDAQSGKTITVNVTNGTGTATAGISMVAVALQTVGADPVMEAEYGAYTYTGQAAVLYPARKVIADPGSFTNNGQSANLLVARILVAAQGTYTYTGQTANLQKGRTLIADSGSFALSGQAANLAYGRVNVTTHGIYSLNGQAINLIKGPILICDPGIFTYTGQQVTFLRNTSLDAETGLFYLSGQDALLTYAPNWVWREQPGDTDTWLEPSPLANTWTKQAPLSSSWTEET